MGAEPTLTIKSTTIFPDRERRDQLLSALRVLGCTYAKVTFECRHAVLRIDDVWFRNSASVNITDAIAEKPFYWYTKHIEMNRTTGEISPTRVWRPTRMTFNGAMRTLCENAVSASGLDWATEEGSQGEFTINLLGDPPEINLFLGINEVITKYHNFEFWRD